jgi:hypothetical protein
MPSESNSFLPKYICVTAATLMSVFFVAFVSLPFSLANPEIGAATDATAQTSN